MSKIQWTDRTWNPIRGCSEVSEGCRNCYAMRQAHRFNQPGGAYEGLTRMTDRGPIWTGKVRLVESELEAPLRWKKPSRVFVNSMSDLFHESVPDEFIQAVFGIMACARHTFQILTKRPSRMRVWFEKQAADVELIMALYTRDKMEQRPGQHWFASQVIGRAEEFLKAPLAEDGIEENLSTAWPLPNVHLGVSVENQATADERIPLLLQTPAAVRFLSVEPLLEAVDIEPYISRNVLGVNDSSCNIHWVIVGGESGPRARPCHLDWLRSIVRQCQAADVRLFVKQWGAVPVMDETEWRNLSPTRLLSASKRDRFPLSVTLKLQDRKGGDPAEWPEDLRVREFPRCHKTDTNAKGRFRPCRLST